MHITSALLLIDGSFIMAIRVFAFALICLLVPVALAESLLTNTYPIKDVRNIIAGDGIVLEIRQGDSEYLRAEAAQEILERVTVDISGERVTLNVKPKTDGFWFASDWFSNSNEDKVKFMVQVKDLAHLELNDEAYAQVGDLQGANLKVKLSRASQADFARLQFDNLIFDLSGAAHILVDEIQGQDMTVDLSGAANMHISGTGKLDELTADLSGASQYQGRVLLCNAASVHASGAAQVDLFVSESLDAHASGAAQINYSGEPRVQRHSSGAGTVNAHDD